MRVAVCCIIVFLTACNDAGIKDNVNTAPNDARPNDNGQVQTGVRQLTTLEARIEQIDEYIQEKKEAVVDVDSEAFLNNEGFTDDIIEANGSVIEIEETVLQEEPANEVSFLHNNQQSMYLLSKEVIRNEFTLSSLNPAIIILADKEAGYCFLATAEHVVQGADRIMAAPWGNGTLPDKMRPAEIIGTNPFLDVAVIAIPFSRDTCHPASINYEQRPYLLGTRVVGYGVKTFVTNSSIIDYPHVSFGGLSGLWGQKTGGNLSYVFQLPASRGFSGGGIFSDEGTLVAMILSVLTDKSESDVNDPYKTSPLTLALSAEAILVAAEGIISLWSKGNSDTAWQ